MFSSFLAKMPHTLRNILIGAGILSIACFYVYYLHDTIDKLEKNNIVLEDVIKKQKETIELRKKDTEYIIESYKEIQNTNEELEKELLQLQEKFTKNGRDFGSLANKKPKLIEGAINKGTKEAFDCFEKLSGNGNVKTNKYCPSLFSVN